MEILRGNELPYDLRSDALSTLKRWSSKTAIATHALCQLIEEDNKFFSFSILDISDVRGDVKAAIKSCLRVAQRNLNSSEPAWSRYGGSPYDKLILHLDKLEKFGASQYQLANLQNALPRLRIARIPFLAEDVLTSTYYQGVVSEIQELGEIATREAHVALVKFWRTCGDRFYEYDEVVADYNDRSGFATVNTRKYARQIRDELKGAARESCDAAKLQADHERDLK